LIKLKVKVTKGIWNIESMDNKKYFDQIIQIFKHEDFIDKEVLLED